MSKTSAVDKKYGSLICKLVLNKILIGSSLTTDSLSSESSEASRLPPDPVLSETPSSASCSFSSSWSFGAFSGAPSTSPQWFPGKSLRWIYPMSRRTTNDRSSHGIRSHCRGSLTLPTGLQLIVVIVHSISNTARDFEPRLGLPSPFQFDSLPLDQWEHVFRYRVQRGE